MHALLRAKPPKGGDAELRDYGEFARYVRRAASDPQRVGVGGPFVFTDLIRRK
jgi:hypothetical protein